MENFKIIVSLHPVELINVFEQEPGNGKKERFKWFMRRIKFTLIKDVKKTESERISHGKQKRE